MVTWFEVATIAFVAQLAVLPGEKAQFIVAGLSTRYHPLLVASAAASAFAGWTVLEVLLGSYLQDALPGLYLDVATGLLFLLFAFLLVRSAPDRSADDRLPAAPGASDGDYPHSDPGSSDGDNSHAATDGGMLRDLSSDGPTVRLPVVDREMPNVLGGFLPIFVLMAVGEFGDKTQLVTIGLAVQYAHGTAIWVGEMAAIVPVTLLNAYVFSTFTTRFDRRRAHFAGAVTFAFFGVDTLQATVTGVSAWETLVGGVAAVVSAVLGAVAISL